MLVSLGSKTHKIVTKWVVDGILLIYPPPLPQRERERQTDRQTETERVRDRRQRIVGSSLGIFFISLFSFWKISVSTNNSKDTSQPWC